MDPGVPLWYLRSARSWWSGEPGLASRIHLYFSQVIGSCVVDSHPLDIVGAQKCRSVPQPCIKVDAPNIAVVPPLQIVSRHLNCHRRQISALVTPSKFDLNACNGVRRPKVASPRALRWVGAHMRMRAGTVIACIVWMRSSNSRIEWHLPADAVANRTSTAVCLGLHRAARVDR